MSNPFSIPANENPGALAGATGAEKLTKTDTKEYAKSRPNAMSLYAQDRHKRAARVIGCALVADAPDVWGNAGIVLAVRLTPLELAALAFTALSAMEPDAREDVFRAAQWGEA